MVVLAMDTATQALAVAVGIDGVPMATASSQKPRSHSRLLQPMLADLMRDAGVQPGQVDQVVVGIGPGSYTGVRLGVATAKAVAVALEVPLIPVSTLKVLAECACPGDVADPVCILPMLYARRGRAFGAIYQKHGSHWATLRPEGVAPIEEWVQAMRGGALTGVIVHDLGTTAPHGQVVLTVAEIAGGMGAALLRAARDVPAVVGDDIHRVVPYYALQTEAEAKLGERKMGLGNR